MNFPKCCSFFSIHLQPLNIMKTNIFVDKEGGKIREFRIVKFHSWELTWCNDFLQMLSFKSWFQIESLSPLPLVPTRTFRNTFPPWKRKHIYCEGFWPSTRPWLKIQQKQIWRKTWTSLKSGNPPQTGSLRSNSPPTPPSISWSHHGTRPFDCTTSTRTPWGFSTSKPTFMFDAVLYTCLA